MYVLSILKVFQSAKSRAMCFPLAQNVRRLPNGRLVEERVRSNPTKPGRMPVPASAQKPRSTSVTMPVSIPVPILGSVLEPAPRPVPVPTPKPIPTPRVATNKADNHLPAVASTKKDKNEESHVDTFAGLAVSSSSSSSDSSSDRGTHESKPKKQTKAKVPVKQCDVCDKETSRLYVLDMELTHVVSTKAISRKPTSCQQR